MKRICLLALITTMSGCAMLEPIETDEVSQATTVVDAVEGDKSKEESSGIIDTMRGRTDPVAGDPAWAPIHPKQNRSTMRQQRALCLALSTLLTYTTIQNHEASATSLP